MEADAKAQGLGIAVQNGAYSLYSLMDHQLYKMMRPSPQPTTEGLHDIRVTMNRRP